jgi:hypothetical protein
METSANDTIESTIATGARLFCAEPWRVERLISYAALMTPAEIERHCNRMLRSQGDMNRAIAWQQLRRACQSPEFAEAFEDFVQRSLAGFSFRQWDAPQR